MQLFNAIANLFSKGIRQVHPDQLNMFRFEAVPIDGDEREFKTGDRRKLERTSSGVRRWKDADKIAEQLNSKFDAYVHNLDETEFCKLARQYKSHNQFNFTNKKTTITDCADVAFIFRQLSDEAIEHSFMVHINEAGDSIIQHLGTGRVDSADVDATAINALIGDFGTKRMYFVHNHPSGRVEPSTADIKMFETILANSQVSDISGVIVDSYRNIYSVFNSIGKQSENTLTHQEGNSEVPVLTFAKQYFYESLGDEKINSPEQIAGHIQASRFNENTPRTQILTLNSGNQVTGRFTLKNRLKFERDAEANRLDPHEIERLARHAGGVSVILISNWKPVVSDAILKSMGVNVVDKVMVDVRNGVFFSSARRAPYEINEDYSQVAEIKLFGKAVNVFGQQPQVQPQAQPQAQMQGQEKQGHKYIKREKDKSGKWKYFYKMPDGTIKAHGEGEQPESGEQPVQNDKNKQEQQVQPEENIQAVKPETPPHEIVDGVDYTNIKSLTGLDDNGVQQLEDLCGNYRTKAEAQKNAFLQDIDEAYTQEGLKGRLPSLEFGEFAVKSRESIFDKFMRNYSKGTPDKNNQLTDILRTTIVINSPKDGAKLLKNLEAKGYELVEPEEDLYKDPKEGYKHIAWKIKKGNDDPIVKEVLLMRPNMLDAKFGLGHGLYDIDKQFIQAMPLVSKYPKFKKQLEKVREAVNYHMDNFYKQAYLKDLAEEKGSKFEVQDSKEAYSTRTVPAETNEAKSSGNLDSSKELPSLVMDSLTEQLKSVWQPISDNFSTFSRSKPMLADRVAKIDEIFSSIKGSLDKMNDKYGSKVINKSSRFKPNRHINFIK